MSVQLPEYQDAPVPVRRRRTEGKLVSNADYAHVTGEQIESVQQANQAGVPLWQHFDEDGRAGGRSPSETQPEGTEPFMRDEAVTYPWYYQADGSRGFAETASPVLDKGSIEATVVFEDQYGEDLASETFSTPICRRSSSHSTSRSARRRTPGSIRWVSCRSKSFFVQSIINPIPQTTMATTKAPRHTKAARKAAPNAAPAKPQPTIDGWLRTAQAAEDEAAANMHGNRAIKEFLKSMKAEGMEFAPIKQTPATSDKPARKTPARKSPAKRPSVRKAAAKKA